MTVDQQIGTMNIRASFFDGAVKQIAKRSYKFKQALLISTTSAWKNCFFREGTSVLAAAGQGNSIKGIPRGASFPQAVVEWERVLATIDKYGLEDFIHLEDILSNDISVRDRTIFKIAEGVVKSVDDAIFAALTQDATGTGANFATLDIQKVEVRMGTASGAAWNQGSAAIIDNLLNAKQLIAQSNYSTENLMCFVNPRDYRSLMNYLADKGAQFPTIGADVAENGKHGKIAGINLVVSNSVSASFALVVVPQICATWQQLAPLTTITEDEPGKGTLVRTWEFGVTQLTDPKAVVILFGTEI